jgi:hypothetical protein
MSGNIRFKKMKYPLVTVLFLGIIFAVYFNGISTVGVSPVGTTTYSHRSDDLGILSTHSMDSVLASLRQQTLDDQIDSILNSYRGTKTIGRIDLVEYSGNFKPCERKTSSFKAYIESIRYSIASTQSSDFSLSVGDRESVNLGSENLMLNTFNLGLDVKDAWVEVTLRAIVKGCDLKLVDKTLPLRLTGLKVGSKVHFNSEVASIAIKKLILNDVELKDASYNLDDFYFLEKIDNLLKSYGLDGAAKLVDLANKEIAKKLKADTGLLDPLTDIANDAILPSVVENFRKEHEYKTDLGSTANFSIQLDKIETKSNAIIAKFSSTVDIEGKEISCANSLDSVNSTSSSYPAYKSGRPSLGFGLGLIGSLGLLVGKEGLFCVSQSGLSLRPAGDLEVSSGSYPYMAQNIVYSTPTPGGATMILSQSLSAVTDTSPTIKLPVLLSYNHSTGLTVNGTADLTINFQIETEGENSKPKFAIKYMKLSNLNAGSSLPSGVTTTIQNILNTYQEKRLTKTYSKLCENNSSPAYEQNRRYERIKETSIVNCAQCEKNIGINIKSLDQDIAPGVMDNFIENTYSTTSDYTISFGNKSLYPRVDEVLTECPPQQLTDSARAQLDDAIEETNDRIEEDLETRDRINP